MLGLINHQERDPVTNKFAQARSKEIRYHEQFYAETELFKAGSWLACPVKVVMDTLKLLDVTNIQVLDLGCGVGRNSIPIAQEVKNGNGTVTCIDLILSAIDLLNRNALKYEVEDIIVAEVADVEKYDIPQERYDYIVACSCLEHVSSEEVLLSKLKQMQDGTKNNGIHCILMSTDVKETEISSGLERKGLIELNFTTEHAFSLLRDAYHDWNIIKEYQVQQEVIENVNGKEIIFRSQWITFVAVKQVKVLKSDYNEIKN